MENAPWTIMFGVIWALLAAAAITCHLGVAKIVPAVEEFPERIEKGFMDELGIGTLVEEIKKVEDEADKIIKKCGLTHSECPKLIARDGETVAKCMFEENGQPKTVQKEDVDSATTNILASFNRGLAKIEKLGKDPYFGVSTLKEVGGYLDEVETQMQNASQSGTDCCVQTGIFCVIYDKAKLVDDEQKAVVDQVNAIVNSDGVEKFEEDAGMLVYLHALPYILVLSTLCFSALWWKNGACCCCKGGSMLDCFGPILLQAIFWLVAFIIMLIISAIGWVFTFVIKDYAIPATNPPILEGEPKIGDVLDHLQKEYPNFWSYVFDGLVEGLEMMRTSSTIFVVVCIVVAIYACCFCCCRPYEVKDGGNASALKAPPKADEKTPDAANRA